MLYTFLNNWLFSTSSHQLHRAGSLGRGGALALIGTSPHPHAGMLTELQLLLISSRVQFSYSFRIFSPVFLMFVSGVGDQSLLMSHLWLNTPTHLVCCPMPKEASLGTGLLQIMVPASSFESVSVNLEFTNWLQ